MLGLRLSLTFDLLKLMLCITCALFVKQEKRKKSNILPNGLVEGEEEEKHDAHGSPELQRTGK